MWYTLDKIKPVQYDNTGRVLCENRNNSMSVLECYILLTSEYAMRYDVFINSFMEPSATLSVAEPTWNRTTEWLNS
jgi:hypothetical protein